jgi:hypothetical protein
MSLSRRRVQLKSVLSAAARLGAIAATLAVAGCASDQEYRREAYLRQQQAMHAAAERARRETELEDDGLPSQIPPPANRKPEIDDPREPYSPNYGKTAAAPQRTTMLPTADDAAGAPRRVATY